MNGPPVDQQTKALEFVHSASIYVLLASIALLAWVASAVEFSNGGLRLAAMACLTLSAIFGVGTLALIPLISGGAASRSIEFRRRGAVFAIRPTPFPP